MYLPGDQESMYLPGDQDLIAMLDGVGADDNHVLESGSATGRSVAFPTVRLRGSPDKVSLTDGA